MALIFDYDAFGTTFTNAYLRITNVNYRYEKMSNDNSQPAQTNLDMQYSIWVGEAQEDSNAEALKREGWNTQFDGAVSVSLLSTAYDLLKAGQGFIPEDAVNTSAATGSDTTAPEAPAEDAPPADTPPADPAP